MALLTGAFVMRDALVTFGGTDYQASTVTKARLVPETPIQTVRTLTPDGVIQDVDSTVWSLELGGLSDWETGGLALYLYTNRGTSVEVELAPRNNILNKVATFDIIAMPVPFGGEQGQFVSFDMTFPVQGQPVFTALA